MALPLEVNVGPLRVPVDRVTDLRDEAGNVCYGRWYPDQGRIALDRDLSEPIARLTLLHEVCHALLELSPLRQQLSEPMEEAIVNVMSVGLVQVVKDNPDLL